MDTLAPVHRKEAAVIVEYHPRREWIGYGPVPIIEQDGKFWITDGKGGGKLLPESKVPPELLAYCKANPKTGTDAGQLQVAKTCEHCGESFLGAEYDQHLITVIRELQGGGAAGDIPKSIVEGLDEN